MKIETQRLTLYPASEAQMEAAIAGEADPELQKAYTEMLALARRHPEEWAWYAMWRIERHDGALVGDLCFKGLESDGSAEIGYGILEEFHRRGYGAEAVEAAVQWALSQESVKRVEAETEPDNIASQRLLAKCGFRPSGVMGKEGPRFYREG